MRVTWEIPLLEVLIGWLSPEGSGQVWIGHFIWSSQHQTLPQGRLGKMRYRKTSKSCGACRWEMPLIISNGSSFIGSDILPNLPGVASSDV